MHDADPVRGLKGLRGLHNEPPRLGHRKRPRAAYTLLQRLALDQLHGDVRPAALEADAVDLGDVGVIELGGQPGLTLEAFPAERLALEGLAQHLDGDGPGHGAVPGAVDGSHAARPQPAAQVVLVDPACDSAEVGPAGGRRRDGRRRRKSVHHQSGARQPVVRQELHRLEGVLACERLAQEAAVLKGQPGEAVQGGEERHQAGDEGENDGGAPLLHSPGHEPAKGDRPAGEQADLERRPRQAPAAAGGVA
jgi:hypothetical protein